MADPKPKEDDLEIPSFLDRRKPKTKPDRKATLQKPDEQGQRIERKPPPSRASV